MRQLLRALWRQPGYTIPTTLTLAVAIGANTAVFSLVNAAVLRPLPLPDPDRIVSISQSVNGVDQRILADRTIVALIARTPSAALATAAVGCWDA